MITETDEQIKKYSIWSEQQQSFIEDAIEKIQNTIKEYDCDRINAAKLVASTGVKSTNTSDASNLGAALTYIGNAIIELKDPNHPFGKGDKYDVNDTNKLRQFFQDIIAKDISTGRIDALTDLIFFDILT